MAVCTTMWVPRKGYPDDEFLLRQNDINRIVYDSVSRMHGAISAEHGLGALKHGENAGVQKRSGNPDDATDQEGAGSRQSDESGQGTAIAVPALFIPIVVRKPFPSGSDMAVFGNRSRLSPSWVLKDSVPEWPCSRFLSESRYDLPFRRLPRWF